VPSVEEHAPGGPTDGLPERHDTAEGRAAVEVALEPVAERLGRRAETPAQIPWPGWKAVLRRTIQEAMSDRISLVSAGCAFWATLALFPAITMLIFVYGLAFDPATVEPQLQVVSRLVPPAVFTLISDRVQQLVAQGRQTLGIGLLVSTGIAFWSSATATKGLISALNIAYEERERRSVLRFQFTALALTVCAILEAVLALAVLVFLPVAMSFLGLSAHAAVALRVSGMAVLLVFVMLALSLLYRFGPSRRHARWTWVTPGSTLATLLWLAASSLFTFYVNDLANYDRTYGPLSTVIAVMMWFWFTFYSVLLGAELNSELELQTARDSTEGPPQPIGQRGAFVADHVAED